MSNPSYYVKKIRKDDEGRIVKLKTSKELEGKPKKVYKRKKVVKHLNKGKDLRTAYLEDGRWTEGDKLELDNKKWLRTEGNDEERDNLGNLRAF